MARLIARRPTGGRVTGKVASVVCGPPVGGAPVGGARVSGAPVGGAPVGGARVSGAPVGGAPVGGAGGRYWKPRRPSPSGEVIALLMSTGLGLPSVVPG